MAGDGLLDLSDQPLHLFHAAVRFPLQKRQPEGAAGLAAPPGQGIGLLAHLTDPPEQLHERVIHGASRIHGDAPEFQPVLQPARRLKQGFVCLAKSGETVLAAPCIGMDGFSCLTKGGAERFLVQGKGGWNSKGQVGVGHGRPLDSGPAPAGQSSKSALPPEILRQTLASRKWVG